MNDTTNKINTHNGHEFVDLGLPSGTLWATCNIGATSPELAGLYFAFGETTGYSAEQVKKGERSFDSASYTAPSVSENLNLEQDAAHVNLGGNWRMPTKAECQELIDNTTQTWTNDYNGTGVAGKVFTSKVNGNSAFFPAAGYCLDSSMFQVGSYGYYWSSTLDLSNSNIGCGLYFGSGHIYQYGYRVYGRPVRGVYE